MNYAHVHLLLNHVPVLGTGFAFLVLAWGIARKNQEVLRTALLLFVLVALVSIPTYLTGEPAGDMMEKLGLSRAAIERHDGAAEIAITFMEILGGASLLGLIFFRRREPPRWFLGATLLLCLITGVLMLRTASLGGQMRHPELGKTAPSPALMPSNRE